LNVDFIVFFLYGTNQQSWGENTRLLGLGTMESLQNLQHGHGRQIVTSKVLNAYSIVFEFLYSSSGTTPRLTTIVSSLMLDQQLELGK
jgi:hypothetical protein